MAHERLCARRGRNLSDAVIVVDGAEEDQRVDHHGLYVSGHAARGVRRNACVAVALTVNVGGARASVYDLTPPECRLRGRAGCMA